MIMINDNLLEKAPGMECARVACYVCDSKAVFIWNAA